jgi:membrane protein YqaA with SNARE-associated domain
MWLRDVLGVTLRDEGKGLRPGVQVLGYAAFSVVLFGFTWVAAAALGPYGGALGAVVGWVLATWITAVIFRSYRARQRVHD